MALIRMYKKFDIWGFQVKKYFMAVYTVIFQLKQDWILRQKHCYYPGTKRRT